jgi:lysophospholipase L1-like esterase
MKKLITILIGIILIAIGIYYYIDHQQKTVFHQPLISQEEEQQTLKEETEIEELPEEEALPLDEETEETEEEDTDEEDSFSDRISQAIQDTIGRIFQSEMNVVAIGDSLTRGVGDETDQNGYVGILERSLNQERHTANVENFGVPGNRSEHLLHRLDEPEIVDALEEADIVLITIGANDIMRVARENMMNLVLDDFMEEREHYEKRLDEILQVIERHNENTAIYLLGIYNPFEMYFEDIEEINQIVAAWNDTGRELTEESEQATFIPVIDLFTDPEEHVFSNDNFHPNYYGYYLIAERVLDYISREEG